MLLSPIGLFHHEFFRFIFVFSALNIRLMTQLEQPRPTTQTCFRTCSLRSFPQASVLSFDGILTLFLALAQKVKSARQNGKTRADDTRHWYWGRQ
jgi:hypothetical protein